jgi:stachyose synthetase
MLNSVKAFESQILNYLQYGGIIGAFNCQGADWDRKEQKLRDYPESYKAISGSVHVDKIEWKQKQMGSAEEYAVYLSLAKELLLKTPKSAAMKITLPASSFELFSFVLIMKLNHTTKFASIGLTNMFNCGGTIQGLRYKASGSRPSAEIKVKGGWNFLAYSSECPKKCYLNGVWVVFE